jgi:S-adenosylmethionine:tRNA ribosyltransferase-isomerase
MFTSDFFYPLPEEQIAKFPVQPRDASRLLVYRNGLISDSQFLGLPNEMPSNALLVSNESKVVAARLLAQRESGAGIEVFLLKPQGKTMEEALSETNAVIWEAMVGNKKRWKEGESIRVTELPEVKIAWENREENTVRVEWKEAMQMQMADILERAGRVPLPPYLNRDAQPEDKENYQTIFAKNRGSVAAPTASLHFTDRVLDSLEQRGIGRCNVTLHVGAGTFKPVTAENMLEHKMHSEYFAVSGETLMQLANHDGPVVPLGTTAFRTLESLFWVAQSGLTAVPQYPAREFPIRFPNRKLAFLALAEAYPNGLEGETEIFIYPGGPLHVADALLTNFHQPGSSLIMLVAALIGEEWKRVYQHALDSGYRFLSYGDAGLLWRKVK